LRGERIHDSEVHEDGMPARGDKYVTGVEPTVDDAARMSGIDGIRQLAPDSSRLYGEERATLPEEVGQQATF
jgi:hypothetical protein